MSLDLDLKNYNYNELLNLFKINDNENRSNILYKVDKKLSKINQSNLDGYIVDFYKKAKNIIVVIEDLINNQHLSSTDIEPFMSKIYTIDAVDNIASISEIDLLNKIKNIINWTFPYKFNK